MRSTCPLLLALAASACMAPIVVEEGGGATNGVPFVDGATGPTSAADGVTRVGTADGGTVRDARDTLESPGDAGSDDADTFAMDGPVEASPDALADNAEGDAPADTPDAARGLPDLTGPVDVPVALDLVAAKDVDALVDAGKDSATVDAAPVDVAPPDVAVVDTAKPDVPAVVCGDGNCAVGESCSSCAKDCACPVGNVCKAGVCASNWPPPPFPTDCQVQAKIVTYNPVGWGVLANAFADDPAPCGDYFIHLPAIAGDKTQPRGEPAISGVHAHGGRFHVLAEFHWTGWAEVKTMTWAQKGVEFRKRMVDKGYVTGRDHWAINELPSTVRTDPVVRQAVRDLVKALHSGPAGAATMGGAVFTTGMGQKTTNFAVYKPALKDWTLDAGFWQDMNASVKWWGQEVYADPAHVCVGSATVAQRAEAVNLYAFHHPRLAALGPAGANAARVFFNESEMPLLNGAWHSDAYNTTTIGLDAMKHFVSQQVYAARAWAVDHPYPDARIAFAWNDQLDGATPQQHAELAVRLASALRHAFDVGKPQAAKACSPTGAYTWCACAMAGAAFNPGWQTTFDAW
ncbi:MAG: hypothetical protein EXR79_15100 [Myxococcales bacterium]|nr:hypothetical protein [Myxococcales bacterium]